MKLALLIILLFISSISIAKDNYCKDAVTNAQWESIAERAIHNSDVMDLYRLRKALCVQIEKGYISVQEATEIFEEERDRVVSTLQSKNT